MKFFDGLYPFEIILLVLGALFLLVLIVLLVTLVAKNRSFAKLLPFFLAAIVMMGYPSIKSVQFSGVAFSLERKTDQVAQNPTDQAARDDLSKTLADVTARPSSSPDVLTTIARAQLVLGDEQAAKSNVAKALGKDPQFAAAVTLNSRIETAEKLPELTSQVEQNPSDTNARAALERNIAVIAQTPTANPVMLANVARAQAALGNKSEALSNANRALQINPQLNQAVEVKNHLQIMTHVAPQ